jgi:hypothetical protein
MISQSLNKKTTKAVAADEKTADYTSYLDE